MPLGAGPSSAVIILLPGLAVATQRADLTEGFGLGWVCPEKLGFRNADLLFARSVYFAKMRL